MNFTVLIKQALCAYRIATSWLFTGYRLCRRSLQQSAIWICCMWWSPGIVGNTQRIYSLFGPTMFRQSCLTCSRYSPGNGNMLGGSRHSVYRMLTLDASYAVLGRLVARDMSIVGCHLEHCSSRYDNFWASSWPCSPRSEYFSVVSTKSNTQNR